MIDAAVVWIAQGQAPASAPDAPSHDDASALSLDAWAKARGVALVPQAADLAHGAPVDWTASEAIEAAIGQAHLALTGLDFEATEKALAVAEAMSRAHPELPNAAWLRAEVERTWSSRWLRGNDEGRAKKAWQRASSLDGGRAAGLGEKAFEANAPVTATIRLEGADADGATLRLDGAAIDAGDVTRGEGDHALALVAADGSVVWSAWVTFAQGGVIPVELPPPLPCSHGDLKSARLNGNAIASNGVRCAHWVAAIAGVPPVPAPGLPGGAASDARAIRVALCEADSCGPLVEWRVTSSASWTFAPVTPNGGETVPSGGHWPAWATWTLVGVGVAGAAIAIVAGSGALKSAPTETHFVNGGLQIHSF